MEDINIIKVIRNKQIGKWQIKNERTGKIEEIANTQKEAIEIAREIAKKMGDELGHAKMCVYRKDKINEIRHIDNYPNNK
ncbi:MAG: DUF2188 domain-containing protein [Bacillales bacterium]|nr:DUF2188 domain-containing protein [Bacillales bacterium]